MDFGSVGQSWSREVCAFQESVLSVVLVLKVETENKAGHLLSHAAVSHCEEMLGVGTVGTGLDFAGTNLCSTSRTNHSGRAASM